MVLADLCPIHWLSFSRLGKTMVFSATPAITATAHWSDLNLHGKRMVRDLWRQQDIGRFNGQFAAVVPAHGVALVRLDKRRK